MTAPNPEVKENKPSQLEIDDLCSVYSQKTANSFDPTIIFEHAKEKVDTIVKNINDFTEKDLDRLRDESVSIPGANGETKQYALVLILTGSDGVDYEVSIIPPEDGMSINDFKKHVKQLNSSFKSGNYITDLETHKKNMRDPEKIQEKVKAADDAFKKISKACNLHNKEMQEELRNWLDANSYPMLIASPPDKQTNRKISFAMKTSTLNANAIKEIKDKALLKTAEANRAAFIQRANEQK